MFEDMALMMIMMWPLLPMFLIELHYFTGFWRRIGAWTYLAVFVEWLPIAYVLYYLRGAILYQTLSLETPFASLGALLIIAGIALHSWTAKLIGIKATIGYTEIKPDTQSSSQGLVTSGPFSVVRHPSYWAHTAILTGLFLVTGVTSVAIVTFVDLLITYFVTTTLEDRELVDRFGAQYRDYQLRVPKFFPKLMATSSRRN